MLKYCKTTRFSVLEVIPDERADTGTVFTPNRTQKLKHLFARKVPHNK